MLEKREIIYLSLYCHHQDDSCIKMGSDESRFNVSLIVRDKVTSHLTVFTNHNLLEVKGEPKRNRTEVSSAYQPNALSLRQTGSLNRKVDMGSLTCANKSVLFRQHERETGTSSLESRRTDKTSSPCLDREPDPRWLL